MRMGWTDKVRNVFRAQAVGWIAVFLFFLVPEASWARGGGGCLSEGTRVLTPRGAVAIERLKKGDAVWSVIEGTLQRAEVQALIKAQPEEYLEVVAGDARLEVTPEHPMMTAGGEYRLASWIQVGDKVSLALNGKLNQTAVRFLSRKPAKRPAYNLLVFPGGTFVSENFVLHNKGCFLPDSQILKSDGHESPIRSIRRGDEVLGFTPEGRMVRTKVREVIGLEVDEYILLKTDRAVLRVTREHPLYVGRGTFKTVEALKEGDAIFAWDGQWLTEQRIVSLERVRERVQVFNLQTDHPNTFFAGQIAVHNKGGGCFPTGTPIRTPRGQTLIEKLSPGDPVLAMSPEGRMIETRVDKIFATRSLVLSVDTNHGSLRTTTDHPLGLPGGDFVPAGNLRPGQKVLMWADDGIRSATVLRTRLEGEEREVYNLSVGWPNTFLAADFVTHNKGGSSSRSSSSRSSSSRSSSSSGRGSSSGGDGIVGFIALFVALSVVVLVIFAMAKAKSRAKEENLDFLYGRNKISPKAGKTEKLLAFLSQQDSSLSVEELRKRVDSTFRKLQECWQARRYSPMQPLMMADLFAQHSAQLEGLVRNHEINRIEGLKVEHVDLVNVRYTEKPDQREFTALITASARDYYVDDRTEKFLRGDEAPARFQEFWTFHRLGDQWLLREIEQSGESDRLKEENFVEMLTDETLRGIYGEVAGKKGEAGPWLEKEAEEKATRIERLLNFLVQTDKLWNRNKMVERAREVFLSVTLARESGDPGRVPVGDLFPEIAESLRAQILRWQTEGARVEYRNLCVRKAELILVRNYADRTKDEYTVRISAHAQRIIHKGDHISSEQEYVTPFEEYWTFGRLGEQWKLKEVLPPIVGKKKLVEENVDEDSNQRQLQWYYRQPRAR